MDHSAGSPVADHLLACQLPDELFAPLHGGVLLFAGGGGKFLVEIAVEADLMASCGDFFYHIRIFVRHDARHEEGSLQAEAV